MATVIRSSAPSACGRERLRSNRHPVTHRPSMLRGIMPIETGAAPAWFPRIPDSGTGPRRGVPDCLRRKSGAEMDLLLQFAGIRSPAIFKVTKNEKLSPSIREWTGLEGLLHIERALFFDIRRGRGGGVGIAGSYWVEGSYLPFWVRLDNFFFACGLQRLQVFQAAGIVALDAALIAVQFFQGAAFPMGVDLKCPGQQVGVAVLIVFLGHRVVAQVKVEVADFD